MPAAIDLLNQVASRLQQEGKTPSLALFKARLSGQLSAPELFAAYQQWRNQPPLADKTVLLPDLNDAVAVAGSDDRTTQLQRIEAKLDKILALLEQQHVSG